MIGRTLYDWRIIKGEQGPQMPCPVGPPVRTPLEDRGDTVELMIMRTLDVGHTVHLVCMTNHDSMIGTSER